MAVTGMAVDARTAERSGTQAVERSRRGIEVALKEGFSEIESSQQSLFVDCGSLILITSCRHVVGSAEFASGIPFVGREITYRLTDIVGFNQCC